ncbi:MAG: threonine--tRNA ligase [Planctomycetota bacterium]|nr:threonine--tRNA ligase [Planctomycetota bacterium]
MAAIKLPDGSVREIPDGSTVMQLAESIGKGLARAAIVGKVDGKLVDLSSKLTGSHEVSIITDRDADGLYVLRHSTAHVLAQALRRLYGKEVQYTIGPVIENGFFYDFELPKGFSVDHLPKVEAEMQKIIEANLAFSREDVAPENAKQLLHQENQRFKDEIIDELAKAGEKSVSIYRQGDFTDLCRGPHIPSTGKIKSFKLMTLAGAYWRGDSNREQLTRIYGTAFFDKKELENHLKLQEESKKRDHRVLGKQLSLFTISQLVGSGLILWMPKGAIVRYQLELFIREELARRGYQQVYTPHIGNIELYKRSGHYPYYRESQFPPIHMAERTAPLAGQPAAEPLPAGEHAPTADMEEYLLKPMNCPHHIQIFAAEPKSYRDLPVRLAEFGTVYRYEESGELNGLTRVRGFTQDDAHLFCTPEQVEAEFRNTIDLVQFVFKSLEFRDVEVRLSLRDPASPKFAGDPKLWDLAEEQLARVLTEMKLPYVAAKGEAAFYGPKVDFMVRDVLGRKWQLGTVQLDYVLPERFGLEYVGADGQKHRPVMIHRAPFGSMERFTGILIEHFAGAFPLWLAPVQVAVLPISEKFTAYAAEVLELLKAADIRAEINISADKIGAKIRDATMQKVPYMLIVGDKEVQAKLVAVRTRAGVDQGQMPLAQFMERSQTEIKTRGADLPSAVGTTPSPQKAASGPA